MTNRRRKSSGGRPAGGKPKSPPKLLDIKQFASLEDALEKAEPGDRYLNVGSLVVGEGNGLPMTMPIMFWFSMISRYHRIARNIKNRRGTLS